MDKPYSFWHGQTANRIFEEVLYSHNIPYVDRQIVNSDAVEWLGYFYSKWHFLTGESSKTIVRFLPVEEGLKNYFTLHQLDENDAIEMCKRRYNLSRNIHRANECKNSGESKEEYDDPIYYSFLSVRLLYKLTKDERYNKLVYTGDKNNYDFVDDEYSTGIKSDVISSSNNKSIIEMYSLQEEAASCYARKSRKAIYFCFVFSKLDKKSLEEKIRELKRIYSSNNRHFHYLYFYMGGQLYEVTSTNELFVYLIPLSQRERFGIKNKMKEYFL